MTRHFDFPLRSNTIFMETVRKAEGHTRLSRTHVFPPFTFLYLMDLWEIILLVYVKVPMRPHNSCSRISILLCGLVPNCGYRVVRWSSRDRHSFSASLPVGWSHPTLAGIKLVIPATHGFVPIGSKRRAAALQQGVPDLAGRVQRIPGLNLYF
jgi:hypothetical protein